MHEAKFDFRGTQAEGKGGPLYSALFGTGSFLPLCFGKLAAHGRGRRREGRKEGGGGRRCAKIHSPVFRRKIEIGGGF